MIPARIGYQANRQPRPSRLVSWLMDDAKFATMVIALLILGGVAIGVTM